jgi:hypothetical protein
MKGKINTLNRVFPILTLEYFPLKTGHNVNFQ